MLAQGGRSGSTHLPLPKRNSTRDRESASLLCSTQPSKDILPTKTHPPSQYEPLMSVSHEPASKAQEQQLHRGEPRQTSPPPPTSSTQPRSRIPTKMQSPSTRRVVSASLDSHPIGTGKEQQSPSPAEKVSLERARPGRLALGLTGSSPKDQNTSRVYSSARSKASPPATTTVQSQEPESIRASTNENQPMSSHQPEGPISPRSSSSPAPRRPIAPPHIPTSEKSPNNRLAPFRAVYPYKDNKDVVVWTSKDPKTAMTTTMTMLDTRAGIDSNSLLSQTRRLSDQRLWQRQMDMQRELAQTNPRLSDVEEVAKDQDHGQVVSRAERRGHSPEHRNYPEESQKTQKHVRDQKSSTRVSSKEKGSKRPLHRVLSGPIFIPNPRGIAPTPSPDVSSEMVLHDMVKDDPTTGAMVPSGSISQQTQERRSQYEEQLDNRIRTVQENNRRLLELKQLLENQGKMLTLQDAQYSEDEEDSQYDGWTLDRLEREKERLEWEEAKTLLGQSEAERQQLKEDLDKTRAGRLEQELQLQTVSAQLKELLELSEEQSNEMRLLRQKSSQDQERCLSLENEARRHRLSLEEAVAKKEKGLKDDMIKKDATQTLEVESLNCLVQDLRDRLQAQETDASLTWTKHADQSRQLQSQVRQLEEQLDAEKERHRADQEARSRVMTQVNDLIREVRQKDDEIHDLRSDLEDRDDLLDQRQGQLNEALATVQSLQVQVEQQQQDTQESEQRLKEEHKKELKQKQIELREVKKELEQERDSGRQHQKRIEILLESQQESSQIHETKVRQLEDELEKRAYQHSLLSSSASSAASSSVTTMTMTIHQLEGQIQDQGHILLEKEDRIQELEQELKLAQQQAQSVVADLEMDIQELEQECVKLSNLAQNALEEASEERIRREELESQLDAKDHDMAHALDDRLDKEKVMLERLLNVMEANDEVESSSNGEGQDRINDDPHGHSAGFFSLLQSKIRELKQDRADILEQRDYLQRSLDEQRQRLEQCEAEIETQHDQLLRAEYDRKGLEDQSIQLEQELESAKQQQLLLKKQLQKHQQEELNPRASKTRMTNGSIHASSTAGRSSSERGSDGAASSDQTLQRIRSLEEQINVLSQEKQQVIEELKAGQDQIQTLEDTVHDQAEAAKSIRVKYAEKIEALQREVVKLRKTVVQQEGQLFLYLSVIEKLKLEQRGAKVG